MVVLTALTGIWLLCPLPSAQALALFPRGEPVPIAITAAVHKGPAFPRARVEVPQQSVLQAGSLWHGLQAAICSWKGAKQPRLKQAVKQERIYFLRLRKERHRTETVAVLLPQLYRSTLTCCICINTAQKNHRQNIKARTNRLKSSFYPIAVKLWMPPKEYLNRMWTSCIFFIYSCCILLMLYFYLLLCLLWLCEWMHTAKDCTFKFCCITYNDNDSILFYSILIRFNCHSWCLKGVSVLRLLISIKCCVEKFY